MLFKAGDHEPTIPFKEVVGRAAKVAPEQIGVIAVKVGAIIGFILIVRFVVVAQIPAFAVKV